MLRTIIIKELLERTKQFSFFFMTAVLMVIFIINGFYFSYEYSNNIEYYRQHEYERMRPDFHQYLYPPSEAKFCCSNTEEQILNPFFISLLEAGPRNTTTQFGNPYLSLTYKLDWAFLVQIIVSLFVIILSYNSFSKEIEQKTLTLIASNNVSRWIIFLGKFFSLQITVTMMLLISICTGLITILMIGSISINVPLMIRLFIFMIISLMYLSLFILIGMGISILTRNSTISLWTSLVFWLLMLILLPESIDIILQNYQNTPNDRELALMYDQVDREYLIERFAIGDRIAESSWQSDEELNEIIENAKKQLTDLANNIVPRYQRTSDYILELKLARFESRKRWKMISPAVIYKDIAEKIVYAGNFRFLDYYTQFRRFSSEYIRNLEHEYGIFHYNNPMAAVKVNEEWISYGVPMPEYEDNNIKFNHRIPTIRESLASAMSEIIFMILLVFGVGIWGFNGFVKCDIRRNV